MTTAQQLTNKRIDNEIDLQRAIIAEIKKAFRKLADLGYAGTFNSDLQFKNLDQEKLQKILTDLRLAIYMWITTYCQKTAKETHESYPYAAAPLKTSNIDHLNGGDKSVKELISIYTNRFKYEAETWLAIGLYKGLKKASLMSIFTNYSDKPYKNPLFINTVKEKPDLSAIRVRNKGVSYGVGQYVSAENSLVRLARYAVADTMREAQWHEWNADDAPPLLGYNVSRGSNYPCSYCDSMCGFHPADRAWLPPYHSRCCCVASPVFSSESKSPISALL